MNKVLAEAKKRFRIKSLAEAYIPSAKLNPNTGDHVAGCPCCVCVSLHDTLSRESKKLVDEIRGIRNWIPEGGTRPLCLLLPAAIPYVGLQPGPYTFCGPRSILIQLEETFASGVKIHTSLLFGQDVNTSPRLVPSG